MAATVSVGDLQREFGIPNIAEVIKGRGDLPKVQINTALAQGEIYLHGAHVTSWKPKGGDEILFLSQLARWQDGKAIRGGVPISFPWFADNAENPGAPAHGFARTRAWQLQAIEHHEGAATVSMSLQSDQATRRWCPGEFRIIHRVSFGQELRLELEVTNKGAGPFRFEEALHTYYRVGDVRKVHLHGLDGVRYLDKVDSNRQKVRQGDVVLTAETDRVYLDTTGAIEIDDPSLRRKISVRKEKSDTTVIWNPWEKKAQAMADLGDVW
jgi:glucose-6-phosphate 1-epimerase